MELLAKKSERLHDDFVSKVPSFFRNGGDVPILILKMKKSIINKVLISYKLRDCTSSFCASHCKHIVTGSLSQKKNCEKLFPLDLLTVSILRSIAINANKLLKRELLLIY